ncbi:putative fructose-1,6-bisphosphatase or related enzymes of inositol monophosphatase family [Hydrogenimonas sp.]|nr:putative fructose-1,6-bisphosphatase or related enzymes of inositol monophosphatase family [Hydrogenimonas sp.]
MTPFVKAAVEAAEEISARLMEGWRSDYADHFEIGAGGDRTAGIDKMAESVYVEALGSFGLIDSEESGIIGSGENRIVLDPIDGSDNALSGLPYFGSSIALERNGRVEEAVIVNLACGEIFYRSDGPVMRGRLSEKSFSPVTRRENARVGVFERAYAYPQLALRISGAGIKFRSPGAVALSLAYARYLEFVIFAGPRRRYDFAAALWMCEDLEIIESKSLLIVAKDREKAELLRHLALQDEG